VENPNDTRNGRQARSRDAAGVRRMSAVAARLPKRVPAVYVVLGVTVYCTLAWTAAIAGIGAGARAFFPAPPSYAQTIASAPRSND
jgi:hypothetical protein